MVLLIVNMIDERIVCDTVTVQRVSLSITVQSLAATGNISKL